MSTKTIQRKRECEIERRDLAESEGFDARPSHPWLACLDCGRLQFVPTIEDESEMQSSPLLCIGCWGTNLSWLKNPCSWCLKEQGLTAPSGTSHGICKRHAEMVAEIEMPQRNEKFK